MIAAIVLAAGRGTRFTEGFKLLALDRGEPLVRHAVAAAAASSAAPVILVTGHRAQEVEEACRDLGPVLVRNPDAASGLSTSLRAGFAALPPEAEGALVLLGDMPRVTAPLLDRLAEAWRAAGRPAALVPTYAGRRGNPVLLSRGLAAEIAGLEGDTGAGPLLRGRADVVEHPVADEEAGQDIDTADALRLLAQANTTPSSTAL